MEASAPLSGDSRPIHAILELLGRRWALRLAWELRRDAVPFGELQTRLGVSTSVLSRRLEDLAGAGIVERDGLRRYRLTATGRELARVLYELNAWAERNSPRLSSTA